MAWHILFDLETPNITTGLSEISRTWHAKG